MKAICQRCGKKFSYESHATKYKSHKRHVCDECKSANASRLLKDWKRKRLKVGDEEKAFRSYNRSELDQIGIISLKRLAAHLRLHEATVQEIERRALAKIRRNKKALQAWRDFVSEGCPVPTPSDPGDKLLEWQLGVAGFYQTHEKLLSIGDGELALECLNEIKRFQERIGVALHEIKGHRDK